MTYVIVDSSILEATLTNSALLSRLIVAIDEASRKCEGLILAGPLGMQYDVERLREAFEGEYGKIVDGLGRSVNVRFFFECVERFRSSGKLKVIDLEELKRFERKYKDQLDHPVWTLSEQDRIYLLLALHAPKGAEPCIILTCDSDFARALGLKDESGIHEKRVGIKKLVLAYARSNEKSLREILEKLLLHMIQK